VRGNRVRFEVDNSELEQTLKQLTAIGIRSLVCQPPTLEELFLRHYSDSADTAAAS